MAWGDNAGHKAKPFVPPQPGENLWQFTGRLGGDPVIFEGSWGRMCFINLYRPAKGRGIVAPIACFNEIAELVIREYVKGDWAKAEGRFHSFRDKESGMLKHQLYLCSIEHVKVETSSFRAKEAALLRDQGDPSRGLFD